MKRTSFPVVASIAAIVTFGCADPRYQGEDGGLQPDSGQADEDGGSETASRQPDAASRADAEPDAQVAQQISDAGPPLVPDAAPEEIPDSGAGTSDAGTGTSDAGSSPITTPSDAAAPVADSGAPVADGGSQIVDAGTSPPTPDASTPPPSNAGCPSTMTCVAKGTAPLQQLVQSFTMGVPFCAESATGNPLTCADVADCVNAGLSKSTCLDSMFSGKFCVQTCTP